MIRASLIAIVVLVAFLAVAESRVSAVSPRALPSTACGDLNGDGVFDITDVVVELRIVTGLIQPSHDQMISGDLDRDGNIDIKDALKAIQGIVGLAEIDGCGKLRNRVVLVSGICSQPNLDGPIGVGDRNPEASEGGVGVPERHFGQIREWLIEEQGYNDKPDRADGTVDLEDEIVYFSYAPDNALPFTNADTRISIDADAELPSSGLRLREFILNKASQPGRKIDLISHSQGGVVALWAALDETTAAQINSIVTLESPVRGLSGSLLNVLALEDFLNLIGFKSFCADRDNPSITDMRSDVPDLSNVITLINQDWKDSAGPYVVNVSSRPDPIVGSLDLFLDPQETEALTEDQLELIKFCCGENGLLDPETVHGQFMMDAGGGISNGHQYPLDVKTNSAAIEFTRQAILDALSSGERD